DFLANCGFEFGKAGQSLAFIGRDRFIADLVTFHMKPPVHDADQRDKLAAIVLDKQNVAVADAKSWSVSDLDGFAIDCAAKYSDCVGLSGITLHSIFYAEGDEGDNHTLRTLAGPLRCYGRNFALKNHFRFIDELIEGRWNDRSCPRIGDEDDKEKSQTSERKFHLGSAFNSS